MKGFTSTEDRPTRAHTSTPCTAAVVTGGRLAVWSAAAASLVALQSSGTHAKSVGIRTTHAT
jgi:hypothetical protein